MWILITIGIIFIVLYSNIVLYISYNENTTVYIRYLFIIIKLNLNKDVAKDVIEKEKKTATKKNKSTKKRKIIKKENNSDDKLKKDANKTIDTIKSVASILKEVYPLVFKLLGKVRITNIDINILIFDTDAAQTAIKYGQIIAIGNTINFLLIDNFMLKFKNISISPNFYNDDNYISVKCRVKIRLGVLLFLLIKIIIKSVKLMLKQK